MLAVLSIYIPLMLFLEVSEETWNCANPRPYPKSKHYVCEWDESDLMKYKGEWLLRPRDMHDNYFEDKVRKVYWKKRGYDNTKIRFKSE